ncbi:prefoldin subunit 5 [Paenibacillus jamilae]|nr:prefoldin subunit 5 [Paenibacillus jamilae]
MFKKIICSLLGVLIIGSLGYQFYATYQQDKALKGLSEEFESLKTRVEDAEEKAKMYDTEDLDMRLSDIESHIKDMDTNVDDLDSRVRNLELWR